MVRLQLALLLFHLLLFCHELLFVVHDHAHFILQLQKHLLLAVDGLFGLRQLHLQLCHLVMMMLSIVLFLFELRSESRGTLHIVKAFLL